ncbi:MAG: hypothetical protein JST81_09175 [Bacteroidetes bacterium]|nr:hypothetical protein [Bacteroidota bacterium]
MEKNFYNNDFEQFLKETVDDFRMYPSKRVWNSLYNNLHPGRKWPSLPVCLLLLSSVIFIGIAHKNEITGSTVVNNKISPATVQANNQQLTAQLTTVNKNNPVSEQAAINRPETMIPVRSINTAGRQQHNRVPAQSVNLTNKSNSIVRGDIENVAITNESDYSSLQGTVVADGRRTYSKAISAVAETEPASEKTDRLNADDAVIAAADESNASLRIIQKELPRIVLPAIGNIHAEKEWIDDYAFNNQPPAPLKTKLQYQFYITPSIGYRTLKQTASYITPARMSLVTAEPDGPNALQQSAGFNFEMGYGYVYSKTKNLKLKGAVQLNYTSYKIYAHKLGHSTISSIVEQEGYSANSVTVSQHSTSLANLASGNDKKYNSSTVQLSIPLGADLKFAGRHNLQWFVGATVQPTYVLFGNAYLPSADSKNYVYDSKFLRKWNVNAAVEAFVSYRTKSGVILNAGPQFRYQFLSSYKSKYAYNEKLYNVGLKIGMIRNF